MISAVPHQDDILRTLGEAGENGLARNELLRGPARQEWTAALAELLAQGVVIASGPEKKSRFILTEHADPLLIARTTIEGKASPGAPALFLKKELAQACRGVGAEKIEEAIALLVTERKLLPIQRGKSV